MGTLWCQIEKFNYIEQSSFSHLTQSCQSWHQRILQHQNELSPLRLDLMITGTRI